MKKVDWNKYKFHCSGLGYLMTNGRSKKDPLSETTKRYLEEIYIEEVWGRKKHETVANKYMRKGTMCETDSLELVEKVTGKKYFKNQKTLNNDYVVGTPDVTKPDLIDIKTSWDLFTFLKSNECTARSDYFYQLLGYMWLTGEVSASLIYCLVDTPEIMTNDEIYRLQFYMSEEEAETYRNNFVFDDIPVKNRIKKYDFNFDIDLVESVMYKVEMCRNYLANLTI